MAQFDVREVYTSHIVIHVSVRIFSPTQVDKTSLDYVAL